MNSWRSTDIEVYITGDKKEIGWVKLPVSKQELGRICFESTGEINGKDYTLVDYNCPYFEISIYDDLEILNKVADIVERLNPIEKEQLLNWCEKYQAGMTDLVEVGNAALQIREGKQEYLDGINSEEALGKYLLEQIGLKEVFENVKNKVKEELKLDAPYLDYAKIGRDYDINNESGYFIKSPTGRRAQGYVNKNEINEFEYKREEFLQLDLDKVMDEEVPFQQNIDDLEEKAMTSREDLDDIREQAIREAANCEPENAWEMRMKRKAEQSLNILDEMQDEKIEKELEDECMKACMEHTAQRSPNKSVELGLER